MNFQYWPDHAEPGVAMTFEQLRDRIAEKGIESVRKLETNPQKIEGYIEGFNLLRGIKTFQELDAWVEGRHSVERWMRVKNHADYWRYHYATVQLEYALEIFKVGLQKFPLSARAILKYAEIFRKI